MKSQKITYHKELISCVLYRFLPIKTSAIHRFHLFSPISQYSNVFQCGGIKARGTLVRKIFTAAFSAPFNGKTICSMLQEGKERGDEGLPEKDSVYRFISMPRVDWNGLTSGMAADVQKEMDHPGSRWCFVLDDSAYKRSRSKSVELATKCFDHADHSYFNGFRMLTLGVTDGTSFVPVSQENMSSSDPEKETQGTRKCVKGGLPGSGIREMATKKATETMLEMIEQAQESGGEASYVLADSWFINPAQIVAFKQLGLDVIGMMKKGKAKLMHYGEMRAIKEIFKASKKRRGRSRYLLSTEAWITTDYVSMKVRLVFVRNRTNRNEYLVIVSTDLLLTEDEIITRYSYRWSIECFFKVFKGS